MRSQQHDELFERWLDTHRGVMFKVARAYAATPPDVEDLLQEGVTHEPK